MPHPLRKFAGVYFRVILMQVVNRMFFPSYFCASDRKQCEEKSKMVIIVWLETMWVGCREAGTDRATNENCHSPQPDHGRPAVYLKYLIMNTMAAAGSGSVADKSQGSWRWRDKKRGWASEHELAPFHHPQLAFTVARVKMLQSTLLARCPIYRGLQFLHRCNIYISALCKRPTRALRICKISCLH